MTNLDALKVLYEKIGGEPEDVAGAGTNVEVLNAISALHGGKSNATTTAEAIINIADAIGEIAEIDGDDEQEEDADG